MVSSTPITLPAAARAAILAWFDVRGRSFPFRGVSDPYAVLVAETMAQQTQIARATERWAPFLARFPTVHALAAASPASVLREWRGLGYNRRALNLWRAARAVVDEHDGRVPDDVAALERLPGVGPYTARAVAALAFGRPVGAVDVNVRRVLGRTVFGSDAAPARPMQAVADAVVPPDRPADWTHALMDLGATVCRAARPACGACPVARWCRYTAAPQARDPRPHAVVEASPPRSPAFESTTRWLRGRLLDRLRDAPGDGWTAIEAPLGGHDREAVLRALAALATDGLAEVHATDPAVARLPRG